MTKDWLSTRQNYGVGYCASCNKPVIIICVPFNLSGRMSPFIVEFERFSIDYAKKHGFYVDFEKVMEEDLPAYFKEQYKGYINDLASTS